MCSCGGEVEVNEVLATSPYIVCQMHFFLFLYSFRDFFFVVVVDAVADRPSLRRFSPPPLYTCTCVSVAPKKMESINYHSAFSSL